MFIFNIVFYNFIASSSTNEILTYKHVYSSTSKLSLEVFPPKHSSIYLEVSDSRYCFITHVLSRLATQSHPGSHQYYQLYKASTYAEPCETAACYIMTCGTHWPAFVWKSSTHQHHEGIEHLNINKDYQLTV